MNFLGRWLPTMLLLVPLCGAAVVLLLRGTGVGRRTALVAALTAFAVSLLVMVPFKWRQAAREEPGSRSGGGVRLATGPGIAVGAEHRATVDGLAYPFVVLTTLLFPLLCAMAWNHRANDRAFFATLLALEFGLLGTFLASDVLWAVAFMAATTAAAWALLRAEASGAGGTWRPAIFLALGLVLVLVGVARLGIEDGTFNLAHLARISAADTSARRAAFALTVLGFLVWAAAVPVHSWTASAVLRARPAVAIPIGFLIPSAGAYGLLRIAVPLFPNVPGVLWGAVALLGVVGVLFGGLCAMTSRDLRSFVGYSTASSIGYVLIGVSLRTPAAYDGAVLVLLGGALAGAMLLCLASGTAAGISRQRTPLWTGFLGVASLAWLVTPVMLGQAIVLMAAFEVARTAPALRTLGVASPGAVYALAIVASFGLIANGAAAARVVRSCFASGEDLREPSGGEMSSADVTVLAVLGSVAALLGVVPGVLCFTFTHPAARALLGAP